MASAPRSQTYVACGSAVHGAPEGALCLQLNGEPNLKVDISGLDRQLMTRVPSRFRDLIRIASYVLAADQAIKRGEEDTVDLGDRWRRDFKFVVGVEDTATWNNDDLRQTLVTIGISIVAADLMLAVWGGNTYQFITPEWLDGAIGTPIITAIKSNGDAVYMKYPFYRLMVFVTAAVIGVVLWLVLNRTRIGMMIRAGVDDRAMLSAAGVNVQMVFAAVFAIGAALAGFAGVVGGSVLSVSPGEDVRYLLASLVVVIVGGMGSVTGAAIGALLVGLAEQIGLVYFPTYGAVFTFVIMVIVLAIRPQGIMGAAR